MTPERYMIDDVLVLTPHKNLVGGSETNFLLTDIEAVAARGPATVVMDLGEINWVSSLGIGLLRKASLICANSGGWLRLARIGRIVENTLLVTGLIIYFETFETVSEAAIAPSKEAHSWAQRRPGDHAPKHP